MCMCQKKKHNFQFWQVIKMLGRWILSSPGHLDSRVKNWTLNISITWRWDIHNRLITPIKYALFSLHGIMFSLWQGNTERESHTFHGSASLWCQRGVQTSVSFGRLAWTPAQKTKRMRCSDARWGFAAYEAVTPRLAAFVPLRSW